MRKRGTIEADAEETLSYAARELCGWRRRNGVESNIYSVYLLLSVFKEKWVLGLLEIWGVAMEIDPLVDTADVQAQIVFGQCASPNLNWGFLSKKVCKVDFKNIRQFLSTHTYCVFYCV